MPRFMPPLFHLTATICIPVIYPPLEARISRTCRHYGRVIRLNDSRLALHSFISQRQHHQRIGFKSSIYRGVAQILVVKAFPTFTQISIDIITTDRLPPMRGVEEERYSRMVDRSNRSFTLGRTNTRPAASHHIRQLTRQTHQRMRCCTTQLLVYSSASANYSSASSRTCIADP